MKEKIKKVFKFILAVLGTIFFGVTSVFYINERKNKEDAEKKKEETKNELEKKSADDIAADSPNPDTISTNIKNEQDNYRKRVGDRLKGKL